MGKVSSHEEMSIYTLQERQKFMKSQLNKGIDRKGEGMGRRGRGEGEGRKEGEREGKGAEGYKGVIEAESLLYHQQFTEFT